MKHVTLAEIEVGKIYTLTFESGESKSHFIHEIITSKGGRYKFVSDYTERNAEGAITWEKKGFKKRAFNVGTKHIWSF